MTRCITCEQERGPNAAELIPVPRKRKHTGDETGDEEITTRMTGREICHVNKLLASGKCFIHEIKNCESCYYMELKRRQQEEIDLRNAKRGKPKVIRMAACNPCHDVSAVSHFFVCATEPPPPPVPTSSSQTMSADVSSEGHAQEGAPEPSPPGLESSSEPAEIQQDAVRPAESADWLCKSLPKPISASEHTTFHSQLS